MRPALVALASCVVGIACIEIAFRLLGLGAARDDHRYVLYAQAGGGEVFRNLEGFSAYQPRASISTAAYYAIGGSWVREYAYAFRTNNAGLVQSADVEPGKPALLVLGDSFTEGQGAPPWFDGFAARRTGGPEQAINGGLLGTGFAQWRMLHDRLSGSGVEVAQLAVVFISDDYERAPWTVHPQILRCIDDYRECRGPERFYGMPPEERIAGFLDAMREARMRGEGVPPPSTASEAVAAALPALTMIARFVVDRAGAGDRSAAARESDRAIRGFVDAYGARAVFVHLPEREEIERGMGPAGAAVREQIRQAGGRLYDGFAGCGLTRGDYHPHDRHPNAQGYAKIARCVGEAVETLAR